jgi:N-acetyl-gamma-glutamylphosphate reductase
MGRNGSEVSQAFGAVKEGKRAVVIATIDNLLKGAATQAVQNLNLAFQYSEYEGIVP